MHRTFVDRRQAFQVGAIGGLTLPQLLRMQETCAAESQNRDVNCIFLFILGGMPHQDMWDLKPNAPSEIRGDFDPISTSTPGTWAKASASPIAISWLSRASRR